MRRVKALPHYADRRLEALADEVRRDDSRELPPHLDGEGRYIRDVTIAATTTRTLSHGLGRRPRGYQVMHLRAGSGAQVIRLPDGEVDDTTIDLRNDSAGEVTFDVWVY